MFKYYHPRVWDLPPHTSPENGKVTIIIPSYNDSQELDHVLGELTRWHKRLPAGKKPDRLQRKNVRILVVNDGSKDNGRTVEVAKKHGFALVKKHGAAARGHYEIIHSSRADPERNLGKAGAVKAGVRRARSAHGSDYVVTLDADLIRPSGRNIERMLTPIFRGKRQMVVARVKEQETPIGYSLTAEDELKSGQRAIWLPALKPWLRGAKPWDGITGLGLEDGLNYMLPYWKLTHKVLFNASPPFRRPRAVQDAQIHRTRKSIYPPTFWLPYEISRTDKGAPHWVYEEHMIPGEWVGKRIKTSGGTFSIRSIEDPALLRISGGREAPKAVLGSLRNMAYVESEAVLDDAKRRAIGENRQRGRRNPDSVGASDIMLQLYAMQKEAKARGEWVAGPVSLRPRKGKVLVAFGTKTGELNAGWRVLGRMKDVESWKPEKLPGLKRRAMRHARIDFPK